MGRRTAGSLYSCRLRGIRQRLYVEQERGRGVRGLLHFVFALALAACGGGGQGGGDGGENTTAMTTVTVNSGTVVINWDANRESAVNRAGGGYRVYRDSTSTFDAATVLDIPHPAPPQAVLSFAPGTYYIKVTAYSVLNIAGSNASPVTKLVVANP